VPEHHAETTVHSEIMEVFLQYSQLKQQWSLYRILIHYLRQKDLASCSPDIWILAQKFLTFFKINCHRLLKPLNSK